MVKLQHQRSQTYDTIYIEGRLGAANSSEIGSELVQILESGPGLVHLDLANLSFLDSCGLSLLVSLLKRARKNEGDLVLFNMNDRIRSLFELTRLHEIFDIRESVDHQLKQVGT